jgi:hypothetical protein
MIPGEILPVEEYSARTFYHVRGNKLMVDELGPLDLRTSEGKSFFTRYFAEQAHSRLVSVEDYPVKTLKERGYHIPDWKAPPPQGAAPQTIAPIGPVTNVPRLTPDAQPNKRAVESDTPTKTPVRETGASPNGGSSPQAVATTPLRSSVRWFAAGALILIAAAGLAWRLFSRRSR